MACSYEVDKVNQLVNNAVIISYWAEAPLNSKQRRKRIMSWSWVGIIWVVAGILVLFFADLIRVILGIALILVGILNFRK